MWTGGIWTHVMQMRLVKSCKHQWLTCVKERILSPPAVSTFYIHVREKKRHIKPLSGLQDCRALFWANKCCGSNPAALLIRASEDNAHSSAAPFAHLLFIQVFYDGICFVMWAWMLKGVNDVGLVRGGEILWGILGLQYDVSWQKQDGVRELRRFIFLSKRH